MRTVSWLAAAAIIGFSPAPAVMAAISNVQVERAASDTLNLTWDDTGPVDVYVADRSDSSVAGARLLERGDRVGAYALDHAGRTRRFFILVDQRDHQQIIAAERLVPLEQGSNFRDIGGYAGAGGKHVRWGLIYRSAGQPLLTDQDIDQIKAMGIAQLVDLRSIEERTIAPTRISGLPYTAVGYPMSDLMSRTGAAQPHNGVELYHRFPTLLAPQLRVIFAALLHRQAPIVYNCSAGQDRTGFATAMILAALGVSRDQIIADYELSTKLRRPEFEMPKLDVANYPNNPTAQMFAHLQQQPNWRTPNPLIDADGHPFLDGAFDEIDAKWGSTDAYLMQEIGLSRQDLAALKRIYLE